MPGSSLTAGDIMGEFDLDDRSLCTIAALATMQFSDTSPPHLLGSKPHQILSHAVERIDDLLHGCCFPTEPRPLAASGGRSVSEEHLEAVLREIVRALDNVQIPFTEMREAMSFVSGRIPEDLAKELTKCIEDTFKSQSMHYINVMSSRLSPEGPKAARPCQSGGGTACTQNTSCCITCCCTASF